MRGLIFDPFAGISGDMTLGALLDLGLEPSWLVDFVASLELEGVEAGVERVDRSGISGVRVEIRTPEEEPHRHLSDVLEIVEGLPVPAEDRERAGRTFRALAEAEARVHGSRPEEVHFHEVGAVDAVVDVVATVAALRRLGVEGIRTRPVTVGSGEVEIAHGRYPLPAPATAELLGGLPVRIADVQEECTTPTGAALLRTLADGAGLPSRFVPLRTGYGAGARNPAGRANVLRVIEAEWDADEEGDGEMHLVQTDVDDQDPEYLPGVRDALVSAGAVDVITVGVGMKKGRPGLRIEALVPGRRLDTVLDALFRESSTIGIRHWRVDRRSLPRTTESVEWRGQPIRVKRSRLPGGGTREKPEHDDVVAAARRCGIPVREARAAIEDELRRRRARSPGGGDDESRATDDERETGG